MTRISEAEFSRICDGIRKDRESIITHNPIGTEEEILLWMLLNCLVSYLNLTDIETPCFNGKPDADTYRDAVEFILRDRMNPIFNIKSYMKYLSSHGFASSSSDAGGN